MTSAPVEFTGQYVDLSSDNGFQWEFSCGRCWTTFRSTFQQNGFARGRGVLRSLADLVGGPLATIAGAADDFSGSWSGSASQVRDRAFAAAVDQVKQHFRHCPACGHWVCAAPCWVEGVGCCRDCVSTATDLCAGCAQLVPTAARFCPQCGRPHISGVTS
jgi:hypothetical protein